MRLRPIFDLLMTTSQMAAADAAAPQAGAPSIELMENAGRAVADEIGRRFPAGEAIVHCGPGNNGGDGYVVARLLRTRGWTVRCETLTPVEALAGDAAEAFRRWNGETAAPRFAAPADAIHVDAMFGAGLSRGLEGDAARIAALSHEARERFVAVDIPSGVRGDTGHAHGGPHVRAALTVTFVRRKPGHLLLPGLEACGDLVAADIGMPAQAIDAAMSQAKERAYAVDGVAPAPAARGAHKYDRGHCLVVSGGRRSTGAARLSAMAAARAGAGLVTLASPADALPIHAAQLGAVMVRDEPLEALLADARRNVVAIGPGLGLDDAAAAKVNAVLECGRAAVLDADALTLLADRAAHRISPTHGSCVLTPHGGEFARLFPDLAEAADKIGKLEATRAAAWRAGCVIVFKGADTVIAAPDGRAAIATNGPPWLATAGSGDVLTGLVAAGLAHGEAAFEAAAAAVWLHGETARRLGPGLLADDLPAGVRLVLAGLFPSAGARPY